MLRSKSKLSNTLMISDQSCTICIAVSLCVWLSFVLIFVSQASDEKSTSYSQNWKSFIPFNNIPLSESSQSINKPKPNPSLSYSISSELSSSGWKPIYLHTLNVRMPIEEMDYLLQTYWYPNIDKNQQQNQKIQHNTVHNIDAIDFSKSATLKKHPKTPENNIITTKSEVQYPSDWIMTCFPSQVNNQQCISHHMQYWSKGVSSVKSKPGIAPRYVTFLKDCGGFNNIRQGFEYHAMVAWVTNRTLVLPPDTPWYLIDRGGLTRGREGLHATNQLSWPDDAERMDGVSNYDIWFDLDDMGMAIPVITASEFIKKEYDHLNIPNKYYGGDIVNKDKDIAYEFTRWITKKATQLSVNLPWGQLGNVLYWPSEQAVKQNNAKVIDTQWIDSRQSREYTQSLQQQPFIHFPSCQKGLPDEDEYGQNYRYLGQIARSIAFDNVEMDMKYKQILRDHVHLKGEIMEYAAMVVSLLGAFRYSSLHIRRNELQYKYVWCTAEESYRNVKPLIGEKETLYIATDEVKSGFFKVFEQNDQRKVYRWKDFFGSDAKFESTKNVKIPGKIVGEVEMAICAMGRMFFGSKESTFSSYIGRLRGYFNAPYTQVLYHHYQLTKDIEESSKISKSNPGKPYAGQIYKIPFKDLWEDIQGLP